VGGADDIEDTDKTSPQVGIQVRLSDIVLVAFLSLIDGEQVYRLWRKFEVD